MMMKFHCSTVASFGLKTNVLWNSKNYKDIFQMESYLPRICLLFNIKEEKKIMILKSKIEDIPFSSYT